MASIDLAAAGTGTSELLVNRNHQGALPIDVLVRVFECLPPGTVFTSVRTVCRHWHDAAVVSLASPRRAVTLRASRIRAYWATHPTKGRWAECLEPVSRVAVRFNLPLVLPEKCPAATLKGLLAAPQTAQINHVIVACHTSYLPYKSLLPSSVTGFPAGIVGKILKDLGLRRLGVTMTVRLAINQLPAEPATQFVAATPARQVLESQQPGPDPAENASTRKPVRWMSTPALWNSVVSLYLSAPNASNFLHHHHALGGPPSATIDRATMMINLSSLTIAMACSLEGLLPSCPRLRALQIIRNDRLEDLNVLSDPTVCPGLQTVHIRNCREFRCLAGLRDRGKLLELEIENCSQVTVLFPKLRLPNLRVLRLRHCGVHEALNLDDLVLLEHIELTDVFFITATGRLLFASDEILAPLCFNIMSCLLQHDRLRLVTTTESSLFDSVTMIFALHPELEAKPFPRFKLLPSTDVIRLSQRWPAGMHHRMAAVAHTLREPQTVRQELLYLDYPVAIHRLTFVGWFRFHLPLFNDFAWARSLTTVEVIFCGESNYRCLNSCENLKVLVITGDAEHSQDELSLSQLSATLARLTHLVIKGLQILSLEPLAGCQRLRSLSLSECRRVTNVTPLTHCSELRYLDLSWSSSSLKLHPLCVCPKLEALILNNSAVLDLTPLSSMRSLRLLTVENVRQFRTDHLGSLGTLPALEWLNLSFTGVTHSEFTTWLRSPMRPPTLLHASAMRGWYMHFGTHKGLHASKLWRWVDYESENEIVLSDLFDFD